MPIKKRSKAGNNDEPAPVYKAAKEYLGQSQRSISPEEQKEIKKQGEKLGKLAKKKTFQKWIWIILIIIFILTAIFATTIAIIWAIGGVIAIIMRNRRKHIIPWWKTGLLSWMYIYQTS